MCGRYFIPTKEEEREIREILEQVNNKYKDTPELAEMKTGEIHPTDIVPVLTAKSPLLMKWSFTRYDGKGQVINARLETAAEKVMFRNSFIEKRCLVPASHYFEWAKSGSRRQKYAIGLRETFYMAGLYQVDKHSIPRFVILTRPAQREIDFIHDRMPVILTKDLLKPWFENLLDTKELLNDSLDNLQYEPVKPIIFQPTLF